MEDYSQARPVHTQKSRSLGLMYVLPLGLVIGFVLFIVTRFFTGDIQFTGTTNQAVSPTTGQQLQSVATAAPTEIQSTTPSPSINKSPDKADIEIKVLNGSGQAGVAARLADELKRLGYTDVSTGNADAYTYTNVTIRRTADQVTAAAQVKHDLEKNYSVTEVQEKTLDSDADLEIVIGKTASSSASSR